MDRLERGICNKYGLRIVYADVSETAAALEKRHLSGPVCSEILGQALVAVTLLSSDLKGKTERISFQLKVDGPVKGLFVEAGEDGRLRGYTDAKLLENFDGEENVAMKDVLGLHGKLNVIHSNDKGIIYSGQVSIESPDIRTAVARYLKISQQVPSGAEIYSVMSDHFVDRMTGIIVQKMPGADTEKFVEILELFEKGEVKEHLEKSDGLGSFGTLFNLPDLSVLDTRELRFGCNCSHKKSLGIMGSLNSYELQEIIKKNETQKVTCHFCGETYTLKPDEISTAFLSKADMNQPS